MEQDAIQEVKDRLTDEPTIGSGFLPLIPDVGDALKRVELVVDSCGDGCGDNG